MSGGPAGWIRRLFGAAPSRPSESLRWAVVDCESSGLDPRRDSLISIGAVALEGGRIALRQEFSVVLRQPSVSDRANILVHGISGEAQRGGIDPREALDRFADFAGDAPLVAFHAAFDRELLDRASRAHGIALKNPWLDLASLAPALYPQQARRCKALDDWLSAFGIDNPGRHDALSDAFATAQLFQVLLRAAGRQGAHTGSEVISVARGRHWLAGA